MPKAYSAAVRARVIARVESVGSRREAAEHYEVSGSTAVIRVKCFRETDRCVATVTDKLWGSHLASAVFLRSLVDVQVFRYKRVSGGVRCVKPIRANDSYRRFFDKELPMAQRASIETLSNSEFLLSRLAGGLPADFDYRVVKSVGDAKKFILILPNCDRGQAAVGLYFQRNSIGAAATYGGIMVAWDHDHREIIDAFGSAARFVAVLKDVAPPLHSDLPNRVDLWRGAVISRTDALRHSIGISWTRNRNIACWFALHVYVPELQPSLVPVVLHANVDRSTIVAQHDARAEQEVIVDANQLVAANNVITLDGITDIPLREFQSPIADIWPDSEVVDRLIASWRLASARYEHWKGVLELQRHVNVRLDY